MQKIKNIPRGFIYAVLSLVAAVIVLCAIWLALIPSLVSNDSVISFVQKTSQQALNAHVEILNPELKTSLTPRIRFKLDRLCVRKDKKILLDLNKIDADISFSRIFSKRIVVNKLGADLIFIDVNKLIALLPQKQQEEVKKHSDWRPDLFNSLL